MKVLTDTILSQSAFSAEVDVPIAPIDIPDGLFDLTEAEYQRRCAPDHIACATTATDDGRRMSINVGMIGAGLVVQHYVAEETTPTCCRMNSISDVFTPVAEAIDGGRTRYTNRVTAHPTDAFMAFIAAQGLTFEQVAAARQAAGDDHNRRETLLFAASIARKALVRQAGA